MKRGEVYFVQRSDGVIKIGFTMNRAKRFRKLEREHGPLKILRLIKGTFTTERQIQKRFKDCNISGELFSPTDDLMAFIDELEEGQECDFSERADIDDTKACGEMRFVASACDRLEKLMNIRRRRVGGKEPEIRQGLLTDYGINEWTIDRIVGMRARTVTAYVYDSIHKAYIAEMLAYKKELEQEVVDIKESALKCF